MEIKKDGPEIIDYSVLTEPSAADIATRSALLPGEKMDIAEATITDLQHRIADINLGDLTPAEAARTGVRLAALYLETSMYSLDKLEDVIRWGDETPCDDGERKNDGIDGRSRIYFETSLAAATVGDFKPIKAWLRWNREDGSHIPTTPFSYSGFNHFDDKSTSAYYRFCANCPVIADLIPDNGEPVPMPKPAWWPPNRKL